MESSKKVSQQKLLQEFKYYFKQHPQYQSQHEQLLDSNNQDIFEVILKLLKECPALHEFLLEMKLMNIEIKPNKQFQPKQSTEEHQFLEEMIQEMNWLHEELQPFIAQSAQKIQLSADLRILSFQLLLVQIPIQTPDENGAFNLKHQETIHQQSLKKSISDLLFQVRKALGTTKNLKAKCLAANPNNEHLKKEHQAIEELWSMTKHNQEPFRQTFNDERDDLAAHFEELGESIKYQIRTGQLAMEDREAINPIHFLYLSYISDQSSGQTQLLVESGDYNLYNVKELSQALEKVRDRLIKIARHYVNYYRFHIQVRINEKLEQNQSLLQEMQFWYVQAMFKNIVAYGQSFYDIFLDLTNLLDPRRFSVLNDEKNCLYQAVVKTFIEGVQHFDDFKEFVCEDLLQRCLTSARFREYGYLNFMGSRLQEMKKEWKIENPPVDLKEIGDYVQQCDKVFEQVFIELKFLNLVDLDYYPSLFLEPKPIQINPDSIKLNQYFSYMIKNKNKLINYYENLPFEAPKSKKLSEQQQEPFRELAILPNNNNEQFIYKKVQTRLPTNQVGMAQSVQNQVEQDGQFNEKSPRLQIESSCKIRVTLFDEVSHSQAMYPKAQYQDSLIPMHTSMLFFNEFFTCQAIRLLQYDFQNDIFLASFCHSINFDLKKGMGPQGQGEHPNEFFLNNLSKSTYLQLMQDLKNKKCSYTIWMFSNLRLLNILEDIAIPLEVGRFIQTNGLEIDEYSAKHFQNLRKTYDEQTKREDLKGHLNSLAKFAYDLCQKKNKILIFTLNKIQQLQGKKENQDNAAEKPEETLKFIGWLIFNELESVMSLYMVSVLTIQRIQKYAQADRKQLDENKDFSRTLVILRLLLLQLKSEKEANFSEIKKHLQVVTSGKLEDSKFVLTAPKIIQEFNKELKSEGNQQEKYALNFQKEMMSMKTKAQQAQIQKQNPVAQH